MPALGLIMIVYRYGHRLLDETTKKSGRGDLLEIHMRLESLIGNGGVLLNLL